MVFKNETTAYSETMTAVMTAKHGSSFTYTMLQRQCISSLLESVGKLFLNHVSIWLKAETIQTAKSLAQKHPKMYRYFVYIMVICKLHLSSSQETGNPFLKPFYSYFNNPIYIDELARVEAVLYPKLKEFSNSVSSAPSLLQTYLQDYEESSGLPGVKPHHVAENPNLYFRIVWRFAKYIALMRESANSDKILNKLQDLLRPPKNITYPSLENLESLVEKIMILQTTFDLKPNKMIRGDFRGNLTGIPLKFHQGLFLANVSINDEFYYPAKDWLDFLELEVINTLPTAERGNAISDVNLLRKRLVSNHDSRYEQLRKSRSTYIYSTKIDNATSFSLFADEELQEWVDLGTPSGHMREKILKLLAICRNSSIYQEREAPNYRKLKCYLEVRDPYFLLQPVKKEVLSKSPSILLFHDVIRDNAISHFYEKGKLKILEAFAKSKNVNWEMISPTMNSRLEKMLNLKLLKKGPDAQRLLSYDYASAGIPHHDVIKAPNLTSTKVFADRIATMLTYISNVDIGGQTVFVDLPLIVHPVKGSMLYWEHYAKNGKLLESTFHGFCPTVLGRKMIWGGFAENTENSFAKRKCSLNPNE